MGSFANYFSNYETSTIDIIGFSQLYENENNFPFQLGLIKCLSKSGLNSEDARINMEEAN